MIQNKRPTLPFGLVVFMVVLAIWAWQGPGESVVAVRRFWEQFFVQYEGVRTAVLTAQAIFFGSFFTGMLTVWILYRRNPGTLSSARQGFAAAILLRIVAPWIFYLMISKTSQPFELPIANEIVRTVLLAVFGISGYLYLSRSRQLRELFQVEQVRAS